GVDRTGVVHEDVDLAELRDRGRHEAVDVLLLRDVGAGEGAADLAGRRTGLALVDVDDHHARALGDIALGDRAADALRAAGDDRGPVLESHECLLGSMVLPGTSGCPTGCTSTMVESTR